MSDRDFPRRDFLKIMAASAAAVALPRCAALSGSGGGRRPNIILCMADDLGWGDTGYAGHPHLETPHLDAMASAGLRFDSFYSGAPVCSPTRGSCLTGRHPYRYGIFSANKGHLPPQELTLAEAVGALGYATGHFGKWHLGTLTKEEKDSNRGGPEGAEHYSPPWENGFDVCFSTEAKVPTWDPMVTPEGGIQGTPKNREPGSAYGTSYWTGPGEKAADNLEGDDARVIMDRVIPFIREAVQSGRPFLAVVWFHTPHAPVIAGPAYRKRYAGLSEGEQHYYGCITAMDEQVGRLRAALRDLHVAEDTMLWFTSDNGPEGRKQEDRNQGSAGPFRGRKRSLFEGGVRVPGLLEWPAEIEAPRAVDTPCCTLDYVPTIMDVLGLVPEGRIAPVDGISLRPLIEGKMTERLVPIAFESGKQVALTDNRYKIISQDGGETCMLFDLVADPGEQVDLAERYPEIVLSMKKMLETWRASCKESLAGKDY
jgi:arylsulfatase A-like enzyme